MPFQVVGYDDAGEPVYQPVSGSVMGSVMGHEPFGIVGRAQHHGHHGHHASHGSMIKVPPAAPWRGGQLAHGVEMADEGMLPMPLSGSGGTNTFSATVSNITFQGQMQKPYRGERLIFIVTRIGASAANLRVQGQIFVGTDLQQGELGLIDFESLGATTAFGTRLTLTPATPGVFLRLQGQLVGGALTGTDTILINTYFLGRVIH
jgi:hypothetical protein